MKPLRSAILLVAFALLAAACGGGEEPAAGGGDGAEAGGEQAAEAGADLGLAQPGAILVGSDIAFEPFEFVQDGENVGFDIDLMDEIAARIGVEAEFVSTGFDTLLTQVAARQFDAGMSAITITEERAQTVDFSDPYFAANQAIAAPVDSDIAGPDDLAGLRVGVQAATTGFAYASETFADSEVAEFPTSEAAFTALRAGQLDAVFIDLPVAATNSEGGDLEVKAEVDTGELYGIAVAPGSDALLEAINGALAEIVEDGTYEEIYSSWFEGDVPEQFATS